MHLPGKSDTGDFFPAESRFGQCLAYRYPAGAPPILWLLLRPSDFWCRERSVFFRCRTQQATGFVDDERSCTARTYVNAKEFDGRSPS